VCPVKIDLHNQLLAWRHKVCARGYLAKSKLWSMKLASFVMQRPWLYRSTGRLARFMLRWSPRFVVYNRWNVWGRQRELPVPPRQSFRQTYAARGKE
jgi:L-lactate dehydrogenase complex protein LldF